MRITSFLAGALCGGLVGGVAALLLAPMAGEEFVGSAKNELEHWVTEAKNAASEKRAQLRAQVDDLASD